MYPPHTREPTPLLFAMTPRQTVDNIITLFCWWCVNQPAIQAESYSGGNGFQPELISDETIDAAVQAFWDDAAGVLGGGED